MKNFLILFLFEIGALCFVVFFATLKPTVVTAVLEGEMDVAVLRGRQPHFH